MGEIILEFFMCTNGVSVNEHLALVNGLFEAAKRASPACLKIRKCNQRPIKILTEILPGHLEHCPVDFRKSNKKNLSPNQDMRVPRKFLQILLQQL